MTQNTIGYAGSMLIGFGLAMVQTVITTGLILVGVGSVLIVVVAILQKAGLNVQMNQG